VIVRTEETQDVEAIRAVHIGAFPITAEADLVDRLRGAGRNEISIVAIEANEVVGHILFTPGTLRRQDGWSIAGLALAPLAVLPAFQRRGIGSALCRAGLDACRVQPAPFVFVLGHPNYYHRFGFRPAKQFAITNDYTDTDAFMIIELEPGSIPPGGAHATYAPEFAAL
jgi:putative acetyltransferase